MRTEILHNKLVDYRSLFWTPEYVEETLSWFAHAPFAFWLTEVLQPKLLVVLGVQNGSAYFSLCQALKAIDNNSVCYGIEEIQNNAAFKKINAYNAKNYAGFSTLLRSTANEASQNFANGSIDLLYIEGLQSYDVLKHSFETWLPKLSKNAIVLFHNINVLNGNSGADKLWEELIQQYPTFQFDAEQGLGVLALEDGMQDELKAFFKNDTHDPAYPFLKKYFSERGALLKANYDNILSLAKEKARLATSHNEIKSIEGRYKTNLDKLQTSLQELKNQQQIIQWYKATYEYRSILGIIKEKLLSAFRKKSSLPINSVIQQPIILPGNISKNRIKKNRYHLIPGNEITFAADTWEFSSEGTDPFFIVHLEKGLKGGWYWLSVDITEIKDNIFSPRLYYNYGRGFNELDIWNLSEVDNGKIESLVYFPGEVTDLRFDPTITKCTFSIKQFHLKPLSKTNAFAIAISGYKKTYFPNTSYLSFFRKLAAGSFKTKNFDFRKKLSDYVYRKDNAADPDAYKKWCAAYDTLSKEDIEIIRSLANELDYKPLFSVIMPVYNAPIPFLKKAIESVIDQAYSNWELCIADDKSTNPAVIRLLKTYQEKDQRIKVVYRETNGHISQASNSALELATGEYIALLDQDDEIRPHGLYMFARALNENKEAKLLYSDEDKIDLNGNRYDPYFKPDWNLDFQHSYHYLGHLSIYHRSIVEKVGGFQTQYDGSQDYDLALRVIEQISGKEICHIPHVLYHWRAIPGSMALSAGYKGYAFKAGLTALNDHLKRTNQHAIATRGALTTHRVFRKIEGDLPKVAIIIPTKDKADLLLVCIASIISKTRYSNYEIIVVDNNSEEQQTLDFFEENHDLFTVLQYNKEFNYSAINNFAVEYTDAEYICFLNNDTEVINNDWLYEMVAHAQRKEVGAVGAKLYYPNDLIQHAGVTLHDNTPGRHIFALHNKMSTGFNFRLVVTQSYLAVTGACLVVKKEKFLEAGKFDDVNLKVAYNDVDLCLKLHELGYKNIWTPFAELKHYESISRGSDQVGENFIRYTREKDFMEKKWRKYLDHDPYYNHNLSPHTVHVSYNPDVVNSYPWKKLNIINNA